MSDSSLGSWSHLGAAPSSATASRRAGGYGHRLETPAISSEAQLPVIATTGGSTSSVIVNVNVTSPAASTVSTTPLTPRAPVRFRGAAVATSSTSALAAAPRYFASEHCQVFPPVASSTGRRYYLFVRGAAEVEVPFVACGQVVALAYLGGSWNSRGQAPPGFASLEEAINAAALQSNRWIGEARGVIEVRWR
jgi:hypothetical protein